MCSTDGAPINLRDINAPIFKNPGKDINSKGDVTTCIADVDCPISCVRMNTANLVGNLEWAGRASTMDSTSFVVKIKEAVEVTVTIDVAWTEDEMRLTV